MAMATMRLSSVDSSAFSADMMMMLLLFVVVRVG
jgi:hypothetical protein